MKTMGTLPYSFGNISVQETAASWEAFFAASSALRERLGSKAYLADRYIDFMLAKVNCSHSVNANDDGETAVNDLYKLCRSILNSEGDMVEHPFYETASTYINAHPLPELGRFSIPWTYVAPLFGKYLEYAVANYTREVEAYAEEVADDDVLGALQRKIIDALDGDEGVLFEAMTHRLTECFAACTALSSFLYGATSEFINALRTSDSITGRQVFQIVLDHPLDRA